MSQKVTTAPSAINPEQRGGTMSPRNVATRLPDHTVSQPRRITILKTLHSFSQFPKYIKSLFIQILQVKCKG